MIKFNLICFLALLCFQAIGQRDYSATRINEKVKIDGILNEKFWDELNVGSDFVNWQPEYGTDPDHKTEFKIAYDDNALYLGAFMQTDSRDAIQTQLTARDELGNTDWMGIIIDTYGNGTQGSEFLLGATGVQFDAQIDNSIGENSDWNEIWYSAVTLTDKGWYAEFKIPYSALRFPKTEIQNWKFNILRSIPKSGQKCSYQPIDPEISGFVNQSSFLKGVKNIKAPLRLSLSPYVTTYMQINNNGSADPTNTKSYSYNGGLDLKYGINEAFTLDMTLIPDFGQVQSDDQVQNLSPFEVRFAENRAFFTEGFDLFNKANLFYSRRVGGAPLHYHQVQHSLGDNDSLQDNPGETQLYNATKISGRTSKGMGIGVFNAIAGKTEATVHNYLTNETRKIETSPLTNYNIVVFDQNLKNNSSFSIINTNVWRRGHDFYDANVTGIDFNLRTENQKWGIRGDASVSNIIKAEESNDVGLRYDISTGKMKGNFLYEFSFNGVSPNYNNNDLGYNTNTDVKTYRQLFVYNKNEEWKFTNGFNVWFNIFYNTTYESNAFRAIHFNTGFWTRLKNLWTVNMWTNYRPEWRDYFEPRIPGSFLRVPGFYDMGWYVGTDDRKKFKMNFYIYAVKYFKKDMHEISIDLGPRYRFNDKFSMYLNSRYSLNNNTLGWVNFHNDRAVIGDRLRDVYTNVLGAEYTFNSKMSLEIRARHYWSKVQYNGFHELAEDGHLVDTDYNSFSNSSYNAFNVDLNYRWRFAPGSDIIINWKNSISGDQTDGSIDYGELNYTNGIRNLSGLPQQNSISLRVIYFINGQNLF